MGLPLRFQYRKTRDLQGKRKGQCRSTARVLLAQTRSLVFARVVGCNEAAVDREALHAGWVEHQEAENLEDREPDLAEVRAVSRHHCQRNALWDDTEELSVRQNVDAAVADLTRLEERCAPEIPHDARLEELALCFAVDVLLRPLEQVGVVARVEEAERDREIVALDLAEAVRHRVEDRKSVV